MKQMYSMLFSVAAALTLTVFLRVQVRGGGPSGTRRKSDEAF